MKETLGQRLQRLRLAAGISQPQLATAAGIPLGTLRNLEQDRRIPRLDTAAALAHALNVSIDVLTGDAFKEEKAASTTSKPRKAESQGDAETPAGKKASRRKEK